MILLLDRYRKYKVNLVEKNLKEIESTLDVLARFSNKDETDIIDNLGNMLTPSYTKTDIASMLSTTEDRVQGKMDELADNEGEFFARDNRKWCQATREQTLKILSAFNIKTIAEIRAENEEGYEPQVILVNKAKGGVAKTTTAIHLAVQAALDVRKNRRVVILDGDIQGSLRHYLAASHLDEDDFHSVYSLIKENIHLSREERLSPEKQKEFKEYLMSNIVCESLVDNLWFIPSVITDIELGVMIAKELADSSAGIDSALSIYNDIIFEPLKGLFDLIIVDSGPSPDALVFNLMYAANHLIIPTTGRTQDFRAYEQYQRLLKILLEVLMPDSFKGFYSINALIVKHQNKPEFEDVVNKVVAAGRCFSTRISENKKYEEAAVAKLPLQIFKTSRTKAFKEALASLTSFYSEVNAIISVHEQKLK